MNFNTKLRNPSKKIPIDIIARITQNLAKDIQENERKFYIKHENFVSSERTDAEIDSHIKAGRKLAINYIELYKKASNPLHLETGKNILRKIENFYNDKHTPHLRDHARFYVTVITMNLLLNKNDEAAKEIKSFSRMIDSHTNIDNGIRELYGSVRFFAITCLRSRRKHWLDKDIRLAPSVVGRSTVDFAVIMCSAAIDNHFYNFTVDSIRMCQSMEYIGNEKTPLATDRRIFYNDDSTLIYSSLWEAGMCKNIALVYLNGDGYYFEKTKESGIITRTVDSDIHDPRQCLYPSLLKPIVKAPTLLIVESNISHDFTNLGSGNRRHPIMILMSPQNYPEHFPGNVTKTFTHFLTSPITGFLSVSLGDLNYKEVESLYDQFIARTVDILNVVTVRFPSIQIFLENPHCRRYFINYLFCVSTLQIHMHFMPGPKSNFYEVESEVVNDDSLRSLIYSMASACKSIMFMKPEDLSFRESH